MQFVMKKTAHFSVDDTIWLFENLGHFQYDSIFEQSTLSFFKELHEKFGLKVSFYCFESFQGLCLQDMTDRYKTQFAENSDWMRFGFHARSDNARYTEAGTATQDYIAVKKELSRIVGTDSVTDFCRIHCYSGNRTSIMAMVGCGLQGLLCAEDSRKSYCLSTTQNLWLRQAGAYFDKELGIPFLKTDIKIEKSSMAHCQNIKGHKRHIEVFTHEWALDEENKQKSEELCAQLTKVGYHWSFEENIWQK